MSGLGAYRHVDGQDRQRRAEGCNSRRRRYGRDWNVKAQGFGAPAEKICIADEIKGGNVEFDAPAPDREGEVWADPGRFAKRQC